MDDFEKWSRKHDDDFDKLGEPKEEDDFTKWARSKGLNLEYTIKSRDRVYKEPRTQLASEAYFQAWSYAQVFWQPRFDAAMYIVHDAGLAKKFPEAFKEAEQFWARMRK